MKNFAVHPVGVIIWIWLLIVLGPVVALSYFFAILIHELGHFCVAKVLGYKLTRFSVSPYGVSLSYLDEQLQRNDELKIAFAGPCANFLSVIMVLGLWWCFPNFYFLSHGFVVISVMLALMNLLPAYPLDGGRIFVDLASCFFSEKMAKRITLILNLILCCGFFLLFIVMCFINFNPTYLLFSVFLFAGVLDLNFETKFEKFNVFKKVYKNFSKLNLVYVNPETKLSELIGKMQTSKNLLFCVIFESGKVVNLSEKMLLELSLRFSIDTKLKNIFTTKLSMPLN